MHFSFSLKYGRNLDLDIDLLGPDPTSSKNKAELKKKTRKLRVSQICRRLAAASFGLKSFTGNRTDTNWSSTTLKGKISLFIVVFKFVMHFVIRISPDNLTEAGISRNNNPNYTRRHKFITHKNNCCQVLSRSRNDQPISYNKVSSFLLD